MPGRTVARVSRTGVNVNTTDAMLRHRATALCQKPHRHRFTFTHAPPRGRACMSAAVLCGPVLNSHTHIHTVAGTARGRFRRATCHGELDVWTLHVLRKGQFRTRLARARSASAHRTATPSKLPHESRKHCRQLTAAGPPPLPRVPRKRFPAGMPSRLFRFPFRLCI